MKPFIIKYGCISGIILATMMLVTALLSDKIGFGYGMYIGYGTMIIGFMPLFWGMKGYRETVGSGSLTFGRAFALGMGIMLVATVWYVVAWMVVNKTLMPDFMDKYAAYSLESMKKSGATQAQLDAAAQQMAVFKEQYKNPLVMAAYTFLEPLPVGVLLALVGAFLAKRKPAPAA
jgi:Protein of unknown function (DUF4199)